MRRIVNRSVPSFWAEMAASDPTAVAGLAGVLPSYELLLNAPLVNGRLLVAHAANASNTPLLQAMFASRVCQPVPSSVLQHDMSGRHALDLALKRRNATLSELLLAQALKLPPHARTPLVESPSVRRAAAETSGAFGSYGGSFDNGSTFDRSAIVRMAELFPHALARQLKRIGIDTYVDARTPGGGLATRRVREELLDCDDGQMAVCAALHPYEDPLIWQRLSGEDEFGNYTTPPRSGGTGGSGGGGGGVAALHWLQQSLGGLTTWIGGCGLSTQLRSHKSATAHKMRRSLLRKSTRQSYSVDDDGAGDGDEGDDDGAEVNDVEVHCGVIGLPYLTQHLDGDDDVFCALLSACEVCTELVSTVVMRATIAYKWHTFGRALWRLEVTRSSAHTRRARSTRHHI